MSINVAIKQITDSLNDAIAKADESRKAVIYWDEQVIKLTKLSETMKEMYPDQDALAAPVGSKKAGKAGKEKLLPKTSGEFWLSLITKAPQKMADITKAATLQLNVTDEDAIKALKGRQANAVQLLLTEGKIASEGERLNRVYFLPA